MSNELSILELDAECGELLPAREALGVFDYNIARVRAFNTAMSFNLDSAFSQAVSGAGQTIILTQH